MTTTMLNDRLQPIGDGRYAIGGIVLHLVVDDIVVQSDIPLPSAQTALPGRLGATSRSILDRRVVATCCRCRSQWSVILDREYLLSIYKVVPVKSSPKTLFTRSSDARHVVEEADGHVCMPLGYERIPSSILSRINRASSRYEQLETLSTIVAELALEAKSKEMS